MQLMTYRVSERGQMALPAEARRRWGLGSGGDVEVVDLGDVVMIVPAGRVGLRRTLREALAAAGGYEHLAAEVAAADDDLA